MKTAHRLLAAVLALAAGCTLTNDPSKLEPGPDTTVPGKPLGLTGVAGISSVSLSWAAATDWDFDHYVVYASLTGDPPAEAGRTTTAAFVVAALDNAQVYDFFVTAVDRFGNVSDPSDVVTLQPDNVAPTVVAAYNPGPVGGASTLTDVIFTFSEPMDPASVEANAVLTTTATTPPICVWSWYLENAQAKCDLVVDGNPSTPLEFSKSYTVTINEGAKDVAGNPLVGTPVVASFITTNAPDTTPPLLSSIAVATSTSATTNVTASSPGAVGVYPETDVVITFNEPMDPAATSGAVTVTAGAGYNGGTKTWDATGAVLTFNPDVNYANGMTVNVSITGGPSGAKDAAGNSLAASETRSFRVARQATERVYSTSIDGYGYSTGGGASVSMSTAGTTMYAGDSSSADGQYVGFMSFPLTGFTNTPSRYKAASLSVTQTACTGTPYSDLYTGFCFPTFLGFKCFWDYLLVSHVNIGATLDAVDFTTPVLSGSWEISSSANPGTYFVDVVGALESDRAAGRSLNQWRLNFPRANDGGADYDYAAFYTSEYTTDPTLRPNLYVTYEYP
jgi:hypothetical protein